MPRSESNQSDPSLNEPALVKRAGLDRVLHAFLNSFKGFRYAWTTQAAFRQECYVLLPLSVLALIVADGIMLKAWLLSAHLLVLIVETLNSAIESTVDRIGLEFHVLSGAAKDLGSLAVLLSFLYCGIAWIVVLAQTF